MRKGKNKQRKLRFSLKNGCGWLRRGLFLVWLVVAMVAAVATIATASTPFVGMLYAVDYLVNAVACSYADCGDGNNELYIH